MEWPRPGVTTTPQPPQHKRNKSSVLKSIISSGRHKQPPSEGDDLKAASATKLSNDVNSPYDAVRNMPLLPVDHPHGKNILGEMNQNQGQNVAPKKGTDSNEFRPTMHQKAYSSLSIKSLGKKEGKDTDLETERIKASFKGNKLKTSKSSTSISTIFKSSRGRDRLNEPKDKENMTPPSSAGGSAIGYAPIWAHFATSPQVQALATTTTVPLNDRRSISAEIALYTPADYSPSKQRNLQTSQPTLGRQTERAPRPKSAIFFSGSSKSFTSQTPSRKSSAGSRETSPAQEATRNQRTTRGEGTKSRSRARSLFRPSSRDERRASKEERNASKGERKVSKEDARKSVAVEERQSKVMAAVAVLNDKAKEANVKSKLNPKDIDNAFESILDARNIPENMRAKMRALHTRIKQDFIKQDRQEQLGTPKTPSVNNSRFAIWDEASSRPQGDDARTGDNVRDDSEIDGGSPQKRVRPRSKTFGGSKGYATPSKKHKYTTSTDGSVTIPKSPSSGSLGTLTGNGSTDALVRAPKPAVPDEFVAYLREVQKPESVEIGKLHKLRLLLRNETVSWVNSFISQGGMTEVVGLLHRIMQIEWREEHEDTLLHETLLCLKGLCTTSLGLRELCLVESTLFPALLAMVFDEERKGPSDFTTRAIIVHIIFTHVASATDSVAALRVGTILSYLADPKPEESARPVGFILDMHQPRPYRMWCKEIVGVTKEVFWIFLHHMNVVPLEKPAPPASTTLNSDSASSSDASSQPSYKDLFFPSPRPPVPAAPYIGGVEWDATSYLATHLDLLNGIIASLPTAAERNQLRAELKASGFEKVMGTSLRMCKEKFYSAVHAGLRTWVAAAKQDGWNVDEVREGPPREREASPKKSPVKSTSPVKQAPKLSLGLGKGEGKGDGKEERRRDGGDDGWI